MFVFSDMLAYTHNKVGVGRRRKLYVSSQKKNLYVRILFQLKITQPSDLLLPYHFPCCVSGRQVERLDNGR